MNMEQDTKQKILDISKSLFYEHGYNNTPIRNIANLVGISNSVLFHYFENKRDILNHIIREYRDDLKNIIDSFNDDFLPNDIDRIVLNAKIHLHVALHDSKLARILVDAYNERIYINAASSEPESYPLKFYMDNIDNKDKEYIFDTLSEFRYYYFRGAQTYIVSYFVNGIIPFNKKNIDHNLVSCFNLFFNIPVDEISVSIKRADRIINLLTFDGLNTFIKNDKISEYFAKNEKFNIFDYYKIVFISDIIFLRSIDSDIKMIGKNIEKLKEKFDKVIILVKNYQLEDPIDVKGILSSKEDFKIKILDAYSVLNDKFEQDFFVASYIENSETKENDKILNPFKSYGIDVIKTIHNLDLQYTGDSNVVTQYAFIFY